MVHVVRHWPKRPYEAHDCPGARVQVVASGESSAALAQQH